MITHDAKRVLELIATIPDFSGSYVGERVAHVAPVVKEFIQTCSPEDSRFIQIAYIMRILGRDFVC
jgi:hypothetical protein